MHSVLHLKSLFYSLDASSFDFVYLFFPGLFHNNKTGASCGTGFEQVEWVLEFRSFLTFYESNLVCIVSTDHWEFFFSMTNAFLWLRNRSVSTRELK